MSSQFTSASCVQAKQVLEGVIHSIIKSMRSMEDGLDDAEISVLKYTHVAHFQFIIGKDTVDDDSVVDATIRSYRKKKGLPCDHSYFTTRGHNDFQKRYKKPIKDILKFW